MGLILAGAYAAFGHFAGGLNISKASKVDPGFTATTTDVRQAEDLSNFESTEHGHPKPGP